MSIETTLAGIDWGLLRKQKLELLQALNEALAAEQVIRADCLQGLVHFLDNIQDAAADVVGERMVFGRI